ncbi:tRNA (adenine(22)-N(1))-methyltransferase [Paenibacillus lutrae]|uniref:tRNA (Adenine-N(1))-methyltransferase n=1 Tax=Paenibacillus lutrae TaxID=2078573 RepID=A0A7X3FGV6_9BACL|nr:class I SAM-dependent methyltransferase [Paenibacillus lutrae]MVO99410.1 tRNA (adenine-N(1))-methyltransferase [Paenibacillus lutrae]
MVKLSKRLLTIANIVPEGARLADIGSDHALLPTYLVQQGRVPFAVAGEVNKGPKEAAERQVRDAGLTGRIEVRLGNGLAVLQPGEIDAVSIAGMGGALIASILDAGQEKLQSVQTLILQPNVGEDLVRRWLRQHGWHLAAETILEEDGKIYEVLTAVRMEAEHRSDVPLYAERTVEETTLRLTEETLLRMGPYLIREPKDAWFRKWEYELDKLDMIRKQLERSTSESADDKRAELEVEKNRIREVLTCLRKDRP